MLVSNAVWWEKDGKNGANFSVTTQTPFKGRIILRLVLISDPYCGNSYIRLCLSDIKILNHNKLLSDFMHIKYKHVDD